MATDRMAEILADIIEELDEMHLHNQEILDNWVGPSKPEQHASRHTIKIRRATYASALDRARNIIRAHGYEMVKARGEWHAVKVSEGQDA